MTPEQEHRAEEAKNLLGNDLFVESMTAVQTDALRDLAAADASNMAEIMRLQAIANCIPEVLLRLDAVIKATGKLNGGMTA